MEWKPIETAPKDGSIILVNDTNDFMPWVAAKWINGPEWEGWIYADEMLADCSPEGPKPTMWFPVPPVPPEEKS